jgi:hypothetical protein
LTCSARNRPELTQTENRKWRIIDAFRIHKIAQAERTGQSVAHGAFVFAACTGSFRPVHGRKGRVTGIPAATRFSTPSGTEVRMAGINWYGAETPDYLVHGLWAQDYHTVLNTIKSLGYNVIRIPFSNQMVESNPVPTNYTTYANGAPSTRLSTGRPR